MSYPYADAHSTVPTSTPGTLKAWAAIAIGGSALLSLLGLFVIIAGAALSSSPRLQEQIQNAIQSSGGTFNSSDAGTFIVIAGVVFVIWGLVWAGLNAMLYYFMSRRMQWAWITALVLLGLGVLLDLAGHSGGLFIHLIFIQVPLGVLLLLSPSRFWVGLGSAPAPAYQTPTYAAPPPPPPAAVPTEEQPPPEAPAT